MNILPCSKGPAGEPRIERVRAPGARRKDGRHWVAGKADAHEKFD